MRPAAVVSLHSYRESFVEIERPPEAISAGLNAAVDDMARTVAIERRLSIGYPTPGALGSFGLANGLLVLTYELERGLSHGALHTRLAPLQRLLERLEGERFVPPAP